VRIDAALTSAWTGKELVVFGRRSDLEHPRIVRGTPVYWTNVAAAYDPRARHWRRLAPPAVVDAVGDESALWTGSRVVFLGPFHTLVYDPATDRWQVLRRGHGGLAVWTGHELLAWGGGCCGDAFDDGVAFDPATGSWRTIARSPLAPSQAPIGAWDGHELLLLVSDTDPNGKAWPKRLARAAAYNPQTDTWRRIARPPMLHPGARAVSTGRELVLFGGYATERRPASAEAYAFEPTANRWRTLPAMESGRLLSAAVWTGSRLLLWGGGTGLADPPHVPTHGLAYDPTRNGWAPLPKAPLKGRLGPTGVWTGRSFLVFGGSIGVCGPDGVHGCHTKSFADGAAFTPSTP
jgi:N-acetylneuraminic acid mutarotase